MVHETGSGTFETSTDVRSTAAFKGNADINRYPHLVLNFRDPAPPSPRGVLAYATVCAELRPLDLVRESLNVGHDGRADLPVLEPGFFTLQVQEPT